MSQSRFVTGRQWCVPQARGIVLEIGFGAGANLPYYTDDVSKLFALEPNKKLFEIPTGSRQTTFEVSLIATGAENISLPNNSIDSIICTWTLCSVDDVKKVVNELHRILKPAGKVIFIEHGKSQSTAIGILQNLTNSIWKRCAGGCNLNRTYFSYFTEAGFAFEEVQQIGTEYRGVAVKSERLHK